MQLINDEIKTMILFTMPILNKLTGTFPAVMLYVTAGILIDIWSLVWLAFYQPETRGGYFWVVGFLFTGLALLAIGLLVGRLGRSARQAELPPPEVINAVAQIEKISAANEPKESPPPPVEKPEYVQPVPPPVIVSPQAPTSPPSQISVAPVVSLPPLAPVAPAKTFAQPQQQVAMSNSRVASSSKP